MNQRQDSLVNNLLLRATPYKVLAIEVFYDYYKFIRNRSNPFYVFHDLIFMLNSFIGIGTRV